MSLEILGSETQYEVFLHHVGEKPGHVYEEYKAVPGPGIEAVHALEFDSEKLLASLSWVDLSRRAKVQVKHSTEPEVHFYDTDGPWGVSEYPEETLLGQRMLYGPNWLVTDRDGKDIEFTKIQDILAAGTLPPYTKRWMSVLAAGNYHPSFFKDLDHLLTGESESSGARIRRELGFPPKTWPE